MKTICMSVIAGVIGTGLGGLLTIFIKNRTDKMVCVLLSFAGGVMTSIVCFDLIPESVENSNIWMAVTGLILGVIIVLLLNDLIDGVTNTGGKKSRIHETHEEFYHESKIVSNEKAMLRSGLIMLFAIALHNIPEGLAVGAAGYHDIGLGSKLAFMIGMHNIPEGMAISAPLISSGQNKAKVIILTLLAGAPTIIGALVGFFIGGISNTSVALSLSIAGGAMLYVVFGEIIPQSVVMRKDRVPTIVLLVGTVAGLLITKI